MSVRTPGGRPAAGAPRDPAGTDPDRLRPVAAGSAPGGGEPPVPVGAGSAAAAGREPVGGEPAGGRPAGGGSGVGEPVAGAARGARQRAPAGPGPLALRVFGGALVAVAAVGLAVVESFLVPLRVGTVPLPVSVLLAVAGNVGLARLGGRWTGTTAGAAVPAVLWLVVVVLLALPRPEGDLVVPGTLTGLVFLFAGSIAGAYGVGSSMTRRLPPAPASRR